MTDVVDVGYATELLQRLEPGLSREERALRAAMPALGEDEVRETALRATLIGLGTMISHATFVYLRWRLEHARRTAPAAVSTRPTPPRDAPNGAPATADDEARALRVPRLLCDAAGERWTVLEVGAVDPRDVAGPRALLFTRAGERRRQAVFPDGWRSLSNDALGALLPPR
jgi:hypothetical protein